MPPHMKMNTSAVSPQGAVQAKQDLQAKLRMYGDFDKLTLRFKDRALNEEFDEQMIQRRYLVLGIWFAVFLALVLADAFVNPYVTAVTWVVRVWHVAVFIPPVLGMKVQCASIMRHITGWTTFVYVTATSLFCTYFLVSAMQKQVLLMVNSHTFSVAVGYLVMLTAWTFILHLPVAVVLLTQLGLWHTMCKTFLLLQLLPGVHYSNPLYQHCLCMSTALVMTGIIYWMMRNTVLLFAERKMAVAREQDIAVREIEFKQRYVAQTLHDIGTPLTSLSFGNNILRASPEIQGVADLLEVVECQAVALEMMTLTRRKAIDFTKLTEEGRLRPRLGAVDIRDIVLNRCRRVMTGYNSSESCEMLSSVADDVAQHILSDRDWVWEMCINLLSNARKFTHRGSIETTVRLVPRETPREARRSSLTVGATPEGEGVVHVVDGQPTELELLIEVTDTGIGIPPDKAHKLFQPFSQLQVGAGGTGLGLYGVLCKSRTLSGDAGYRPNPHGQGSVFFIRLPYIQVDVCPEDAAAARSDGLVIGDHVAHAEGDTHPVRPGQVSGEVLIVDDDAMSRKLMGRMLQNMGCTVMGVASGEEALELMKAQRFAVAFLDLNLPGTSGFQVILQLREWERHHRTSQAAGSQPPQPLVVLSGTIIEEDRQQALDNGADDFMSKPVGPKLLQSIVQKFVQPPRQQRPSGSCPCSPPTARGHSGSPHPPPEAPPGLKGSPPSRPSPTQNPPRHPQVSGGGGPRGPRRRVLLVEDERSIAKLVRRLLESNGYEVEWAPNGMAGLMKMQEAHGTLWACLCDLNMPLLDGFEMVRRYRQWECQQDKRAAQQSGAPLRDPEESPRLQGQPAGPEGTDGGRERGSEQDAPASGKGQFIAALSACSTDEDVRLAKEAGIDAFLTKPVQLSVMLSCLEERQPTLRSARLPHGA